MCIEGISAHTFWAAYLPPYLPKPPAAEFRVLDSEDDAGFS